MYCHIKHSICTLILSLSFIILTVSGNFNSESVSNFIVEDDILDISTDFEEDTSIMTELEPKSRLANPYFGRCAPVMNTIDLSPEPNAIADPLYGRDLYIFYIAQIVEQYYPEVDPYIVLAVLETESNYQPDVQSSCGAIGLMQVMPIYHYGRIEKYGLDDLWDPYTNIICGMDYLNDLWMLTGDWVDALYGYNRNWNYVYGVLEKADILRGGNYFGDAAS